MIEQKKKMRLDDIQVDSFVTEKIDNKSVLGMGSNTCPVGQHGCTWTCPESLEGQCSYAPWDPCVAQ